MWSEGVIAVPASICGEKTAVHYWIKHFSEPSRYGINNGHISKLLLQINGETVCSYDRGWDIRPTNKAAEAALAILLYEYDGRDKDGNTA